MAESGPSADVGLRLTACKEDLKRAGDTVTELERSLRYARDTQESLRKQVKALEEASAILKAAGL